MINYSSFCETFGANTISVKPAVIIIKWSALNLSLLAISIPRRNMIIPETTKNISNKLMRVL